MCEGKCSARLRLIYVLWISLTLIMHNDKHMSCRSFKLCKHAHTHRGIGLNYKETTWSNTLTRRHKRTAKTSCRLQKVHLIAHTFYWQFTKASTPNLPRPFCKSFEHFTACIKHFYIISDLATTVEWFCQAL